MKLAGVVILYNPPENINSSILTYNNYVEKLFIVDNSFNSQFDKILLNTTNTEIIRDGENRGIASRLNQVLIQCQEQGFSHLLTMDQDSFFSKNDFSKYIELIKSFNMPQIGMIGLIHDKIFLSTENEENKILITSGSIINVDVAIKVGMFDENLFIDGVDTEFCLKLWGNRYKTILVKSILLNHSLGFTVNPITPSLRKEYRTIHNNKRIYYIVRNHFYLRNKFRNKKDQLPFKSIINEIKNAFFYGNEKGGSLKMALKGYVHFLKRKMGKQI